MKWFGWHVVLISAVLEFSIATAAQTVALRVDVPFQFNIGNQALPAGEYLIQAPQGDVLKIVGPNGVVAFAMANQLSGHPPTGTGNVDFTCYGKQCFLTQFWSSRTETGKELVKSQLEKELAAQEDQPVVIALKATPEEHRKWATSH